MSGDPGNEGYVPSQSPRAGDEAPAGTPGAGENTCRHCEGKGRMPDGSMCAECNGTGIVLTEVGGA